jgi:hypothetical protein
LSRRKTVNVPPNKALLSWVVRPAEVIGGGVEAAGAEPTNTLALIDTAAFVFHVRPKLPATASGYAALTYAVGMGAGLPD